MPNFLLADWCRKTQNHALVSLCLTYACVLFVINVVNCCLCFSCHNLVAVRFGFLVPVKRLVVKTGFLHH